MTSHWSVIPDELFLLIRHFVIDGGNPNLTIVSEIKHWRNLLHSSKIFENARNKHNLVMFEKKESLSKIIFFENCIRNPLLQIHMNYDVDQIDLLQFSLNHLAQIQHLKNVYREYTHISSFYHVCISTADFVYRTFHCKSFYSLTLQKTSGTQISMNHLENVNVLRLINFSTLEDISPLRKVTILDISDCMNVKDISMLGAVSSLNIIGCKRIIHGVPSENNLKEIFFSKCHVPWIGLFVNKRTKLHFDPTTTADDLRACYGFQNIIQLSNSVNNILELSPEYLDRIKILTVHQPIFQGTITSLSALKWLELNGMTFNCEWDTSSLSQLRYLFMTNVNLNGYPLSDRK
jgi:hypothetical protein